MIKCLFVKLYRTLRYNVACSVARGGDLRIGLGLELRRLGTRVVTSRSLGRLGRVTQGLVNRLSLTVF